MPFRIGRIPTRFLRTLLLRGTAIGLVSHLIAKGLFAYAEMRESAAALLPGWVLIMTVSLMLVDLHRRKEIALLHNLGITTSIAVLAGAFPALPLELAIVMLAR